MEYNLDWLMNDYGKFLEKFGLDERSVRGHYSEWQVRSGLDSARDYLWYLFQVILGETAKQVTEPVDLQKNNLEIYTAMWFFRTHMEGQRSNELLQLINDTKIRLWQLELPFHFRVKLSGEPCCAYCDHLHGQFFKPDEILEHRAFVLDHCTSETGCSCTISPIAERDEAGQIILKDSAAN
ncbi:MAG: hypothetical protein EOO10_06355 [Chitinophagaceae bacterium]|nr:MAG: hypothetical protein EOO10_06355 [Chitinophagaceae bacterium]